MSAQVPATALQLRSLVTAEGELQLSLASVPVTAPGEDEVVVIVDASPINPSDLGLLFGGADMPNAVASGAADAPVITAQIPEVVRPMMAARAGASMPVGNEGGGVVVSAGTSAAAQALLGKTVGMLGGAMYSQYRTLHTSQCLALPDGTTAAEGASCFVNPLTALGMVETMRLEGHTALLHTAAASNLGQMLQKICINEGVKLVNVVRSQAQVDILNNIGAEYVCNSSAPTFTDDLADALTATGATVGFDATGGGSLASQVLSAMEVAANRSAKEYSRYGSNVFKQVYIYGGLERSQTTLSRTFGMSWALGGWLLMPFLERIGAEGEAKLRQKVASEIKTTFASSYTREISLAETLSMEAIKVYGMQATGEKFLINPNK
jgi:NADPH2:quinone reductase